MPKLTKIEIRRTNKHHYDVIAYYDSGYPVGVQDGFFTFRAAKRCVHRLLKEEQRSKKYFQVVYLVGFQND